MSRRIQVGVPLVMADGSGLSATTSSRSAGIKSMRCCILFRLAIWFVLYKITHYSKLILMHCILHMHNSLLHLTVQVYQLVHLPY